MIPSNTHDGVLPPFIGESPHITANVSPYRADLSEVVLKYSTSDERIDILKGLVAYRNALRKAGITVGYQWIDGSFVEDCENIRGRAPSDIDIITFAIRPIENTDDWRNFIRTRPDLFDPATTKALYKCDAYFIDLATNPFNIVNQVRYWFGLMSHQRESYLWKGMIEVLLSGSDNEAEELLEQGVENAS